MKETGPLVVKYTLLDFQSKKVEPCIVEEHASVVGNKG